MANTPTRLLIGVITASVLMLALGEPGGGAANGAGLAFAQHGTSTMFVEVGDLVTATGRGDALVRLRPKGKEVSVTRRPLGLRLVPKAVTVNKFCEKVAIANAHNVVVHDVWSGATTVIEHPEFGELADVQYDWGCNLIIADMGRNAVAGKRPKDGRLWSVTPEGEVRRIGTRRRWSNPAFLEMDEWGTLYVVDKGAGPKMPGSDWHFDAIYKLGPPAYVFAVKRYRRRGLDVTAFVHHPDGRFFIGNGDELLVLQDDRVRPYCPGTHFRRINGLAIDRDLRLFLLDGFDVFGSTRLLRVDDGCALTELASGSAINGSQGLAAGLQGR